MRIIEVAPRDGLQNEPTPISTEAKAAFIQRLADAGLKEIEATSFVSPKWVPQLGDAADLWPMLPADILPSALIPNLKGLERAIEVGVKRIAVFTAVSESFVKKNINMTVGESLEAFRSVVDAFRDAQPDGWVRGYVSTAFQCPYEGRIDPEQTARICEALLLLGCDEISIGDTVGAAAPKEVKRLASEIEHFLPYEKTAWHFHDTRGTAIANAAAALDLGYEIFDASAGGLGGCPYAPGAGGNLATEDLAYFLDRSGVETGINLELLAQASLPVLESLGREPSAKAQRAILGSGCI